MIGTYVNVATIVIGTIIGSTLKKGLNEKQSHILMQAMGFAAIAIGINSFVSNMQTSTLPVLFIISLAIGGFLGQSLNLYEKIEKLSSRTKNIGNIEGIITGILLFCFGTLSILGPIESALNNNHTFLFTNATLDFVTSMVLASTFGFSILYSAVFLFCWQGLIYFGATSLEPFITEELMSEIGIVGGILIMITGFSILNVIDVKTINFLPALIIPPVYFLILLIVGS